MAGPCILMARQHGPDQSHIVVLGARWFETSTVMPPEWERARVAFFTNNREVVVSGLLDLLFGGSMGFGNTYNIQASGEIIEI